VNNAVAASAGARPGHSARSVTTSLMVSNDGNWWWSNEREAWIGVLEGLPANTPVSPDRLSWWDGSSWRPFPPRVDRNMDGQVTTSDASPQPTTPPGQVNSDTIEMRRSPSELPPPKAQPPAG
jgi:hypothetical protein